MWVYIWNKLPSEYQEVEYIQSSGTQYIDTWLTVSGNVKADYEYTPTSSSPSAPVFMDTDWRNNWFGSWNTYIYYWGNTSNNEWYTVGSLAQNVKAHDIVAKSWCSRTLNWTTVSYTPSSSYPSPSWTLKLFAGQRAGSIISYNVSKLYSFKRYDSWVLTQDMIPCYRKSDSVIGLYDLVNNQFYTNAWTWTFSKWSDVNTYRESSLKNAYIGEVWTPTSNTLWYYPLTSQTTVNDMSWNWNNLTNNWVTFWNYGWHDSGIFNRSWFLSLNKSLIAWWQDFSVSVWFKYSVQTYYQTILWIGAENSNYNFLIWAQSNNYHLMLWWWNNDKDTWYVLNGDWKNCVVTHSGWTAKVYINWSLIYTGSVNYNISNNVTRIWYWVSTSTSWSGGKFEWWISEVIIENNVWSADKVLNYYNNTKSNYWL